MDLVRTTKAHTLADAIALVLGSDPIVTDYDQYSMISFSADQQKKIRDYIKAQLAGKPGDIRIDTDPIVNPLIIEQAIPYVIGIFAAGAVIGWLVRGR